VSPLPPPLWQQLHACATVVAAVRGGASGTTAIEATPAPLRAGVQALAFHVWRNAGRAEALRRQLAPKRPPTLVDALLCTALALVWDAVNAPYDAFTLVNQTVEAAKRHAATRASAHFVNACLRRFLRECDALIAATESDPVAVWNYPAWWIARVQRDHPQAWQTILQTGNHHAPMSLRVNRQKTSVAAYQTLLETAGIGIKIQAKSPATPEFSAGSAIILEKPVPVQRLPHFADGWVSVQDVAAQMAAPLLLQKSPLRILDACAAPGGKTGHLLELAPNNATVLALEIDAKRVPRIHENLHRLGVQAEVRVADAAHITTWWDGQLFDAILLDAPCTASGIVRRHPDVRWLRRESDIAQLATLQRQIVEALWATLRVGGRLVYCTCSVFRAEGSEQIEAFLARHADAALLPSCGHLIADADYDGFYYALLEKRETLDS
jgi:16S rRNA (cytosine967-C5)-methyltransferase